MALATRAFCARPARAPHGRRVGRTFLFTPTASLVPPPRTAPASWSRLRSSTADAPTARQAPVTEDGRQPIFEGLHHVGLLVADLDRALAFYTGVLGLQLNSDRPDAALPYRGAWLWIGREMVHLMELPSPDPTEGRPTHGGRDRHFCVGVRGVAALAARLDAAGMPYTQSASGRPAIFFRDPDANVLECAELGAWR